MNPATAFTNLSATFLPGVDLVFVLIGLFGLIVCGRALYDLYRHVTGEQAPGMMPKEAIFPVLLLAGAAVVVPVVLWQGANTFALGGNQTYDMFAYVQDTNTSNACENLTNALTQFFMLMGAIAIFRSAQLVYSAATNPGRGVSYNQPIIYAISGVMLFFINDMAAIAGHTVHMNLGLSAVCTALGAGSVG